MEPFPGESWSAQLDVDAPEPDWLWHGLLAPGQTTLLTGLWKTGKTTLLALLLNRRHSGAPLLDRPIRRGATVVITEEPAAIWRQRLRKLPVGPDVCFFFRPFRGQPTPEQFAALIDRVLQLHAQRGVDLVVVDPLARFLPLRTENSAPAMLAALAPLHRLTEADLAVLLMHHPSKGRPMPGQAPRGSGALPAHVDILLELRPCAPGDPADRRRQLLGYARSVDTPPALLIELNAEATDYTVLPPEADNLPVYWWPVLQEILDGAKDKLTRIEIMGQWPKGFPRPSPTTLWRWLDVAVERGLVAHEGLGHPGSPFQYWLPGRDEAWLADPLWRIMHGLAPRHE